MLFFKSVVSFRFLFQKCSRVYVYECAYVSGCVYVLMYVGLGNEFLLCNASKVCNLAHAYIFMRIMYEEKHCYTSSKAFKKKDS